jgi:hypothetical protein
VRDGQTSPHRPRLVVSRSTCPPISPPHVNSFVLGPAVINTHGATKTHDWMVGALGPLFRTAGHIGRTQHGVTANAGQRGDVEIRSFLQDVAGSRSLVFDLSMTHNRFGSSSHVQQNSLLSHPQDLDAPLCLAAQRKINSYRQQYADNQNISFLPDIVSTSKHTHAQRVFASSFSTGPPGDRGALHCRWNVIATQPIGLVSIQAHSILPVSEEQSRTRGSQSTASRINLNVEGCGIVAAPVHAPSRAPLLLPLLLSHNLPLPRFHIA